MSSSESIHPAIRVICFLVLAAFIALGHTAVLVVVAGVVTVGISEGAEPRAVARRVWRMRWLLGSILMTYVVFTPGTPFIEAEWGRWLPTMEGASEGLQRVAGLVLLIVSMHWMIGAIPRSQLVATIRGLTRPFAVLGLSGERLAVRLALILDAVPLVERSLVWPIRDTRPRRVRPRELAQGLAVVLDSVLRQAEQIPLTRVELVEMRSPPVAQWAYPVVLALLLVAIQIGW